MDVLNKVDDLDRIIISTKEKIEHVVGWYALAKRKLGEYSFKMPFDEGVIEFTEFSICLYFKKISESEIRLCLTLTRAAGTECMHCCTTLRPTHTPRTRSYVTAQWR